MADLDAIKPVVVALLEWRDAMGPVTHLLSVEDLALLRAVNLAMPALRRLAAEPVEPQGDEHKESR